MRRLRILWMAALVLIMAVSVAYAVQTVYKKHAKTGGTSDALDGIDGNTLHDGDICFVLADDMVYWYENDADGSLSEDDPLVIVPDANPGTNSWLLKGTMERFHVYNCPTTTTLSGATLQNSFIGNYGAKSEVTYTLASAVKGMSFNISLDQGVSAGSSIWVVPPAGDKIINQPNFVTGSSAYYLAGVTGAANVTFVGIGTSTWKTFESGTPEQKTI
ncbi:MAG: hypothetical protein ABIJ57_00445 [Pseudomonadota bacterium]